MITRAFYALSVEYSGPVPAPRPLPLERNWIVVGLRAGYEQRGEVVHE